MKDNLLERAYQLYEEKSYESAIDAFSKIASELNLSKEKPKIADTAMQMAIKAYFKLTGEKRDFYAIYRHYWDRKRLTDKEVEFEIYSEIEPSIAQKKVYFDPYSKIFYRMEENEVEKFEIVLPPYTAAMATARGPRKEMEDEHLATTFEGGHLFAVFDGHGGDLCAHYVKSHLKQTFDKYIKGINPENDTEVYHALVDTFIELDESWKLSCRGTSISGTTALVSVIIKDSLWVASVGDSRAVLNVKGKTVQLSQDAKPYIRKYYDEIVTRGGQVLWDRVDGSLDMARSIGDINHPSVSARPEIRKHKLNHNETLILACDGLWDVIGSQEAIEICVHLNSVAEMAEALKTLAYESGSTDNVTVMVVDLQNIAESTV